ncbi:MAG: hypothetical protein SH857_15985 [Chitinophagales bacterium]|nr:hypothetical protein [Chitinophagales bacterium]
MNYFFSALLCVLLFLASCNNQPAPATTEPITAAPVVDTLRYPEEKHLKNVRQLTFGGDNAEAYFSFAGDKLTYQWTHKEKGITCDQIFFLSTTMQNGSDSLSSGEGRGEATRISTGKGRTTCSYFLPGDSLVLYASTHITSDTCPQNPNMKDARQYLWPLFDSYEIFIADLSGNVKKQLTDNKFYDAEATVSPKGDKMVFTSTRTGDCELFTMNLDGSNVKQVTTELGYDGGAFFSPDGSKLVFRASRPKTAEEQKNYKALLAKGLVAPSDMEIFVCNLDGSDMKQITTLGKANWAPYFHPSGNKIIFCSNHQSEKGFPFHLYMINMDGTGLEQITFDPMFDSFPMFSPDGKQLAFCSNRFNGGTRDTNIFLAEWVE